MGQTTQNTIGTIQVNKQEVLSKIVQNKRRKIQLGHLRDQQVIQIDTTGETTASICYHEQGHILPNPEGVYHIDVRELLSNDMWQFSSQELEHDDWGEFIEHWKECAEDYLKNEVTFLVPKGPDYLEGEEMTVKVEYTNQ